MSHATVFQLGAHGWHSRAFNVEALRTLCALCAGRMFATSCAVTTYDMYVRVGDAGKRSGSGDGCFQHQIHTSACNSNSNTLFTRAYLNLPK
jgi:hypothetical protein